MKIRFGFHFLWFLFLPACVHVQEIEIEPESGGIISVSPPRDPEARSKATAIMKANCGSKKPKIVKEGFVKIGEQTTGQATKTNDKENTIGLFTGKKSTKDVENTTTNSSTREVREWRIQYKCL